MKLGRISRVLSDTNISALDIEQMFSRKGVWLRALISALVSALFVLLVIIIMKAGPLPFIPILIVDFLVVFTIVVSPTEEDLFSSAIIGKIATTARLKLAEASNSVAVFLASVGRALEAGRISATEATLLIERAVGLARKAVREEVEKAVNEALAKFGIKN